MSFLKLITHKLVNHIIILNSDWVRLEERIFKWCSKHLYEVATEKWKGEAISREETSQIIKQKENSLIEAQDDLAELEEF